MQPTSAWLIHKCFVQNGNFKIKNFSSWEFSDDSAITVTDESTPAINKGDAKQAGYVIQLNPAKNKTVSLSQKIENLTLYTQYTVRVMVTGSQATAPVLSFSGIPNASHKTQSWLGKEKDAGKFTWYQYTFWTGEDIDNVTMKISAYHSGSLKNYQGLKVADITIVKGSLDAPKHDPESIENYPTTFFPKTDIVAGENLLSLNWQVSQP